MIICVTVIAFVDAGCVVTSVVVTVWTDPGAEAGTTTVEAEEDEG